MFTPKLNTPNRSRIAVDTGRDRIASGDRRSSSLFTPKSKATTPLVGRVAKYTVTDLGSRSVLENDAEHLLTEYGLPIPVAVTETLALKTDASAKLDRNGWAWFVSGCKLVIWNYKQTPYVKAGQWFELSLPASKVSHSASLVAVFNVRQVTAPSCIAISSDGILRYWSNVTLDTSYVEVRVPDLHDDSCYELIALQSGNCIVGTSSGAMFFVSVTTVQGRVTCRHMKPAQGMLSGIGRRVSSFFFTPAPTQSSPLRRLLPGEMLAADTQAVYILTAEYLQKWILKPDSERLVYQINIEEMFGDDVARKFWKLTRDKLPNLKTWLLDIQLMRDGLVVFAACANTDVSMEVKYVIGTIHTEGDEPPQSFIALNLISHITVFEEIEQWIPQYKMLLPSQSASFLYLYNSTCILCISVAHPELVPEVVDFPNLGCGCTDDLPLFISNEGDLVAVRDSSVGDMSTLNFLSKTTSFQQPDTSLAANISQEKIEELSQSGNDLARLKAAFLASIQDPMSQMRAQLIVDDLFPPGMPAIGEPGSSLDLLVGDLSQEMIDDYPASDPRWAESLPNGIAPSSVSLILIHQLEDKQKAHELFLRFLKNVNIWSRLTVVHSDDGIVKATNMLLCEHAEKLEASKALHDFHTEHPELVKSAIEKVLMRRQRDVAREHSLTVVDLFYREVSRVQEICDCLVLDEEEYLASEIAAREVFNRVSTVNSIIIGMLLAAIRYRQSTTALYQVSSTSSVNMKEFVPWTASALIRSVLRRQYDIVINRCTSNVSSVQEKSLLFQQLLDLTDIFLDGYRVQLDSIKAYQQRQAAVGGSGTDRYVELLRKYEQERTAIIKPFVKHGEVEKAASLAEKYCDFACLVEICEQLNNHDRLRHYMDHFQQKGFSDFVFKWYIDAGKRGKLMASDLSSHPLLSKFLDSKENQFMSWLHDIQYGDFYQAHKTLMVLAEDERDYAAKRKTLLSLSKLAALACDEKPENVHENIQVINNEHDLLLHQEQLPPELIENFGMDPQSMPVLSAKKVAEMYISDYYPNSNEYDFKKALDVVQFFMVGDPERDDLILEIWCKAILKDDWRNVSTDNPVESCRETVFYRTLELVISVDGGDILPTADGLFCCDLLGSLRHQQDFRFLIQAILEHMQRQAVASAMSIG